MYVLIYKMLFGLTNFQQIHNKQNDDGSQPYLNYLAVSNKTYELFNNTKVYI